MLRTHRAGKGPGGCGGWGLGSRSRRGPGLPPIPGLIGQGTSPGSPAGFLVSGGWGSHPPLLSCPYIPGGPLLPTSPDVPSLPPMPPGTHVAWGGGFGGQGIRLGAQQAPWSKWAGQSPSVSLMLLLEGPSLLPLLISPASWVLILSGLHLSSHLCPPTTYRVHLGVPPISLRVRVPYQQPAGTLVVGRHYLSIFPHHHLLKSLLNFSSIASVLCFIYFFGHAVEPGGS